MSPTTHLPPELLTPTAAAREGNEPIFALNAEARRRAGAGESILNATLGALMRDDGTLSVLPSVRAAFERVPLERGAAYAPIAGDPPFLEAVIGDLFGESELARQAVAVTTPGATGAIHHAVHNFLEPGQNALTTSFYWGPYGVITEHAGRGIDVFRMFDDALAFDLAAFQRGLDETLARQGRALVLLNFPCHNPTGYSLSDGEWDEVAEIVADAGRKGPVTMLLDAAYVQFAASSARGWTRAVPKMLESAGVLVAWTISKSFSQYGARVGALVALHRDPEQRARIGNALSYSCRAVWSNCNHLGILAATELLTDPELVRRTDEERASQLALMRSRVSAFNQEARGAGLAFPRYDGGFFVTVLTGHAERVAGAMRRSGVYVVPVQGGLRVALCSTPESQVPRLVASIVDGIQAEG